APMAAQVMPALPASAQATVAPILQLMQNPQLAALLASVNPQLGALLGAFGGGAVPAPGGAMFGRAAGESDAEEDQEGVYACVRARRLNAQLADALGACRCWGRRRDCPECGGEGRAGFHPIDRGAFAAFVAPAVVAEPEMFLGLLRMNAGAARNQT